jgi:ribosome biogenesis GTPase / thiamine phosphate phosphatase
LAGQKSEGVGQIVRLYAEVATVQMGEDAVQCAIRGKLFRADPPAVGDYVRVEDTSGGTCAIVEVLPRETVLARRAAGTTDKKQVIIANIDQVVVVFAAARPEPEPATLDRFLAIAEANDLPAIVVVNKIDLVDAADIRPVFAPYDAAAYPLHYTSVKTGQGLEELRSALENKESVLVGPSGVGKSSLLNALFPGLDLRVGEISEAVGKGRHTTVGGLLLRLPGNVTVADTAGLREVGLWLIPPDELPYCFPEFREHLGHCRFSDCAHLAEPDCAIRTAVETGEIPASRYASYVKLRHEATEAWPRW